MTEQEIQAALNAVSARVLALGMSRPSAELHFSANGTQYAKVSYYDEQDVYQSESYWGNSAREMIALLNEYLATIPPREDRERTEYLRKLAATIEYGKKIGIDEEFINPLALQMKKLSSNIIEHKPALVDDDVPF